MNRVKLRLIREGLLDDLMKSESAWDYSYNLERLIDFDEKYTDNKQLDSE